MEASLVDIWLNDSLHDLFVGVCRMPYAKTIPSFFYAGENNLNILLIRLFFHSLSFFPRARIQFNEKRNQKRVERKAVLINWILGKHFLRIPPALRSFLSCVRVFWLYFIFAQKSNAEAISNYRPTLFFFTFFFIHFLPLFTLADGTYGFVVSKGRNFITDLMDRGLIPS